MFYTYAHYTNDGRLFYIGKGRGKRAYAKSGRNAHWHNIVNKYGAPEVQILANWKTEEEALSHESLLISCFRDLGHKLCNLADGGKGNSGVEMSEETKLKISIAKKGTPAWNKGIPLTDECKKKLSASLEGRQAWNRGIPHKEETKEKLSLARLGKPIHSEEFKAKMRAFHTGSKWNLGRPASEHQRKVAREKAIGNQYAAGNTNQRKWVWVGTHTQTGEVVRLVGEKALKEAGFQHANIIKCINGLRKSHKGYTWTKEEWEGK